ncbi:hypothetical protein [Niveispirillum sp. SYP-B3756]|uniref:hypothetical protein n=1 Tax=Niveispirillum sp. SYP-B3756 TaxID=2662178 RepID=UPI001B3BC448|nr:hypothetical protein [Niveispirillum sp. SYP-B3756]
MPITISIPDALRQSVEAATGGRNTVLYDQKGYPSIMVVVPRFNLTDIDPKLGAGFHPAFTVNGIAKSEIFVGKFPAVVHDGAAVSLPSHDPSYSLTFDQARGACTTKGVGWHLMTNATWSAVALWCWRNGFLPRGNTSWGKSSDMPYETGRRADGGSPGITSGAGRTLTGSGPTAWCHDNSSAGISDLVGNLWEWVGGLRTVAGELQVLPDNDGADGGKDQSATSALWRAISIDGALVPPASSNTLKYDSSAPGGQGMVGVPVLSTVVGNSNASGDATAGGFTSTGFEAVTTDTARVQNPPAILKTLGLFPAATSGLGGDIFQARNHGERLPIRGGDWSSGGSAGLFALNFNNGRTGTGFGFRPAFIL